MFLSTPTHISSKLPLRMRRGGVCLELLVHRTADTATPGAVVRAAGSPPDRWLLADRRVWTCAATRAVAAAADRTAAFGRPTDEAAAVAAMHAPPRRAGASCVRAARGRPAP